MAAITEFFKAISYDPATAKLTLDSEYHQQEVTIRKQADWNSEETDERIITKPKTVRTTDLTSAQALTLTHMDLVILDDGSAYIYDSEASTFIVFSDFVPMTDTIVIPTWKAKTYPINSLVANAAGEMFVSTLETSNDTTTADWRQITLNDLFAFSDCGYEEV